MRPPVTRAERQSVNFNAPVVPKGPELKEAAGAKPAKPKRATTKVANATALPKPKPRKTAKIGGKAKAKAKPAKHSNKARAKKKKAKGKAKS